MNSMRIFGLVLAVITAFTRGKVHDVVLCTGFSAQQTIQCGANEIIDIQSATIAGLEYPAECSPNLVIAIMELNPNCKRSYRDKDVYSRCQGKQICSVDGSMVDVTILTHDCIFDAHSNVLWFNYKCHTVHDVVLCTNSNNQQNLQCSLNEIIDIQSVTLASIWNYGECSVDLAFYIHFLIPSCKSSRKSFGKEVYSRCHGEQSCTLNGTMVDQQFISYECNNPSGPDATVMWFNYTCHHVNKSSPSVVLLPLPDTGDIRGFEVEIFSPYYPCYIARTNREYELDCKITPRRRYVNSQITYRVQPRYIEILQNTAHCKDRITFDYGPTGGQLLRQYCGESGGDKERWNHDNIYSTNENDFHIKYFTTQNAGDGTKFWFIVSAEEYGEAIEVSVTCSGQENIPSLSPDSSCVPFPITTTTTPAITTTTANFTTTTDRVAPSAGDQKTNGGLVGGLIATSIVIVIVVAIAIILGLKLRKSKRDKQEDMQPTNSSPDYVEIPDHLVGTGTGNTNPFPVMYKTPISMATDTTTMYEDIGPNATTDTGSGSLKENLHAYVNSALPDVTEGADTCQYEDVIHEKQYEKLKKPECDNTKDVKEPKIYTGLENSHRLSKA